MLVLALAETIDRQTSSFTNTSLTSLISLTYTSFIHYRNILSVCLSICVIVLLLDSLKTYSQNIMWSNNNNNNNNNNRVEV